MFANCKSLKEATSDGSRPDGEGHGSSLKSWYPVPDTPLPPVAWARRLCPAETVLPNTCTGRPLEVGHISLSAFSDGGELWEGTLGELQGKLGVVWGSL